MDRYFVEIKTTSDDQNVLKKIAEELLRTRLAACIQIGGPILSTYTWKGKVEQKKEWTLSAKSLSYLTQNVSTLICENHNYEEPEVISVRFEAVSDAYAIWLNESIAE